MRAALILAAIPVVVLVGVLFFADEIARVVCRERVESPVPLPRRAEIRRADRLIAFLRRFSDIDIAAITVGYTILIDGPATDLRLIRHERGHVFQRMRDGRSYLFRYVAQMHLPHRERPYELDAFAQEGE